MAALSVDTQEIQSCSQTQVEDSHFKAFKSNYFDSLHNCNKILCEICCMEVSVVD